jgi:hypothetical protein
MFEIAQQELELTYALSPVAWIHFACVYGGRFFISYLVVRLTKYYDSSGGKNGVGYKKSATVDLFKYITGISA